MDKPIDELPEICISCEENSCCNHDFKMWKCDEPIQVGANIVATVDKIKNYQVTVLKVGELRYILQSKDQFGRKGMREIKFRAKRIDMDRWVYGQYVVTPLTDENSGTTPDAGWFFLTGETRHCIVQNCVAFVIDLNTLGQYTGLKDKNGKEIYENHIVKQTYHAQSGNVHDGSDEDFHGHHIGRVVITVSKGVCMKHPLNYSENTDETFETNQYKNVSGRRCEIIGDIHENPELMGVKE